MVRSEFAVAKTTECIENKKKNNKFKQSVNVTYFVQFKLF
jgi:hypothetical protein